jgi:predicted methyltransferase MtxX (methanogen marker protein 4)
MNDNWKSDQQAELEAISIQPSDDRESALIERLVPGNYTAIVRGALERIGVGLVEVYNLQ